MGDSRDRACYRDHEKSIRLEPGENLWGQNAQVGCCRRSMIPEQSPHRLSGLQAKVLFEVDHNALFSTIANVSLWEQNAQVGYLGLKSHRLTIQYAGRTLAPHAVQVCPHSREREEQG